MNCINYLFAFTFTKFDFGDSETWNHVFKKVKFSAYWKLGIIL